MAPQNRGSQAGSEKDIQEKHNKDPKKASNVSCFNQILKCFYWEIFLLFGFVFEGFKIAGCRNQLCLSENNMNETKLLNRRATRCNQISYCMLWEEYKGRDFDSVLYSSLPPPSHEQNRMKPLDLAVKN